MAEESIKPGDVSAPKSTDGMDPVEAKKVQTFFEEYVALSKRHGYDIGARIDLSDPTAIKAVPMIVKIKIPNTNDESK